MIYSIVSVYIAPALIELAVIASASEAIPTESKWRNQMGGPP
jgi:hypothetical protein